MAKGNRQRGSMPTVEWGGRVYSLKSRKTEIPRELLALADKQESGTPERFKAIMWLNAYTRDRGYSRPNPLAGLSGVITVVS